jgi:diguanylate cyclase (GGDEF)-like protein
MTHADVGGILAEQWKLPPLLATPVAFHHAPEKVSSPQLRKLTELVGMAGACADVFVDEEAATAIARVRQMGKKYFAIDDARCDALLDEIGVLTKEAASLFEINLGSAASYESILKKANETLVEITLQSQQQASQLQQQNQKLTAQAITDALTGLANRARFDQVIVELFTQAAQGKKALSLLLIDLDKFKNVNDKHGHPAGDAVLRAVGRLLRTAARPQDLAARYGGEEMALLMPQTPRATAAAVAETVRRAIAANPVNCGNGVQLPVTASIGVACFEPGGLLRHRAQLIKAADLALYHAKHSGRNCVKVFTLKPAQAAA